VVPCSKRGKGGRKKMKRSERAADRRSVGRKLEQKESEGRIEGPQEEKRSGRADKREEDEETREL
jgi:hypothetical protein